jgi:hypothetical protein
MYFVQLVLWSRHRDKKLSVSLYVRAPFTCGNLVNLQEPNRVVDALPECTTHHVQG